MPKHSTRKHFRTHFSLPLISFNAIQGVHIGSVYGIVRSRKLSSLTPSQQIIYANFIEKHFLPMCHHVIFSLPLHILSSLLGFLFKKLLLQLFYFLAKLSLNTSGENKHFICLYFCTCQKISKYEFIKGIKYNIFICIS